MFFYFLMQSRRINSIMPESNYHSRQNILLTGKLRYDRREFVIQRVNNKAPALIRAIQEIKAGARTTHYGSSEFSYFIQFIIKQIVFTVLSCKPIAVVCYLSSDNAI
jgi:hypothetical protein